MSEEGQRKALLYACKLLAHHPLNSHQLTERMKKKAFSPPEIEETLATCTRLGYIDDQQWAQLYVRGLLRKKFGRSAILAKCRQKGLSMEEATQALQEQEEEFPEKERVSELLQTKYRNRDLKDPKEKKRVAAALCRKGFSSALIWEALSSPPH